jgi:hypothetical protein
MQISLEDGVLTVKVKETEQEEGRVRYCYERR